MESPAPTSPARLVFALALLGLSPTVAGADSLRGRILDAEDRAPRWGLATGPSTRTTSELGSTSEPFPTSSQADASCSPGQCRDLVFARPRRCQLHKRTPERKFMQCGGEDRRLVTVGPHGIVAVKALPDAAARNPYPLELVAQWRYCPFAPDAVLERALVPYEDPDIGRCYLLRPRAPEGVTTRGLRVEALSTLHPYLADAMERLLTLARARGDEFRVISTIRAAKKVAKTTTRKVKVRGRWKTESSTTSRYQGGGWHAFGLAIDINIEGRKDLGSATAAFLRGGPERAAWLRLGAQAESFGLIWLGRSDPNEIFHFEWHPGWPGMPKGALYQSLAQEADDRGIPSNWRRLAFESAAKSPFRHLRDERVLLPASATQGLPEGRVFEEVKTPKDTKKSTRKRPHGKAKAAEKSAEASPVGTAVDAASKADAKAPKLTRAEAKKAARLAAKEAKARKADEKKAKKQADKEAKAKRAAAKKDAATPSKDEKAAPAEPAPKPKDPKPKDPKPKRAGTRRGAKASTDADDEKAAPKAMSDDDKAKKPKPRRRKRR
ncbi:MAG: D-alanyl-D-alanine carboxypeptidase family protein [Myxococcales bacterium]|nr:D-alanyl-D-alanine carboxypeptidase family protein [Myxococcales bacterium]